MLESIWRSNQSGLARYCSWRGPSKAYCVRLGAEAPMILTYANNGEKKGGFHGICKCDELWPSFKGFYRMGPTRPFGKASMFPKSVSVVLEHVAMADEGAQDTLAMGRCLLRS